MALRASEALYAAYSWLLFGLLTPVVWALVVALPHPSRRWAVVRGAARAFLWASRTPLSVEGLENLPKDRACVLVANHASYLDSLALASAAAPVELCGEGGARRCITVCPCADCGRIWSAWIKDGNRECPHHRTTEPETHRLFAKGLSPVCRLPLSHGCFYDGAERACRLCPSPSGAHAPCCAPTPVSAAGTITTIWETHAPDEMRRKVEPDRWAAALRLRDSVREDILRHSANRIWLMSSGPSRPASLRGRGMPVMNATQRNTPGCCKVS
jgi:hypothetical protein